MKAITAGKDRLLYPEVLRTVAILGVITQHAASRMLRIGDFGTTNYQIAEIFHILVQWCVPLFLSISGIFLLDPKRDMSLKKIYFSYIPRILIAIIIMVPLCEAVDILLKGKSLFEMSSLKNIVYDALICSQGNKVYWYLYMLLGIYLYLPIFRAIIKGLDQKGLLYLLVIVFIGTSVIPYILMLNQDIVWLKPIIFFTKKLKMTFMFQQAYFLFLGYYLHTYPPTQKAKKILYASAVVSMVACITIGLLVSAAEGHYVEKWITDSAPFQYVATLGLFLFFQEISKKFEKNEKAAELFLLMGKNSFGVYLIHIMIMRAIYLISYRPSVPALLYIPMVVLTTYLITNVIVYVLRKIPFFRYWL